MRSEEGEGVRKEGDGGEGKKKGKKDAQKVVKNCQSPTLQVFRASEGMLLPSACRTSGASARRLFHAETFALPPCAPKSHSRPLDFLIHIV